MDRVQRFSKQEIQTLQNRRLVVIAGGSSAERDISLAGGRAVLRALRIRGHHVVWLDPQETDPREFDWQPRDLAYLVLHGIGGEDGTIQTLLDERCVPYTGSSATASEQAFSKSATRECLRQHDLPTPAGVVIHETDSADRIHKLAHALGFPLVVKPDRQGSSLGVSIVHSSEELAGALAECFHYDSFGLLETFVAGTEWTVGLLDGEVLPAIRIETRTGFYDFAAKYNDDGTRYVLEHDLPPAVIDHLTRVAQRAAKALGCSGAVRVDLRLDQHLEPWVLEVNTIPGMTNHSLLPKAAAQTGIEFEVLCEQLAVAALKQVPESQSAAA